VSWWSRRRGGRRLEGGLEAELRDHIERQVADYLREGLDEAEARRRARLAFGGLEQIKEDCRDARGARWREDLLRDGRHAARVLWRSPRFTAAAGLAIALGMGANVTFFALVHAVLLRPLSYRDPERLVSVSEWHPERGRYGKASGADVEEWTKRGRVFEDVGCYWDHAYTITGTPPPEPLVGWQFSGNVFGLLGARALLGRTLLPEDGRPGHEDVVVISEGLWHRRFAASPAVIGQGLPLDGRVYTVVGVMPREFAHPDSRTDVWTPLVLGPELLSDREHHPLRVVARLRDDVTLSHAHAEMQGLASQLAREHPASNAGWRVEVRPIRDLYVGDVRRLLWLLQGAVLLLLLIGCSNVASLALARAAARERETALRLALGARPSHLMRQFLAEGVLLAAIGTAGGVALAVAGVQVVPRWLRGQLEGIPVPDTVQGWLAPPVLLATAAGAIAIGVALGSVPLIRGLRLAEGSLKSDGRGSTDGVRTRRLRHAFVVTQIALSVCLLVGAGLLIRSFERLQSRPLGFQTGRILTAVVVLPPNRYPGLPQGVALLEPLVERLRSLPGTEAAGAVNTLPLTGMNARRPYQVPGGAEQDQVADFRIVTPQYFAAMGVPLKRGRFFDDHDRDGAEGVAIVNEALARRLWPDRDPVGQSLVVPDMASPATRTVVGVVGDVRHHGLATEPEPEIYRPAYQAYWPFFALAVRVRPGAPAPAEAVRAAVASLDGDLALTDLRWLDERAADSVAWRRASMALLGVFAGAALLLASFGVYSVVSYAVYQRQREIGVRMALGAEPGGVARAFLARGVVLAGWGVGLGLAVSVVSTGALRTLLFGVTPLDATTYAAVVGLTLAVTILATLVPALSAARVDPTVALRAE
jgi:predicted permease